MKCPPKINSAVVKICWLEVTKKVACKRAPLKLHVSTSNVTSWLSSTAKRWQWSRNGTCWFFNLHFFSSLFAFQLTLFKKSDSELCCIQYPCVEEKHCLWSSSEESKRKSWFSKKIVRKRKLAYYQMYNY